MNSRTCERLIDGLLDQAISQAEFAELQEHLQHHPEARALYYRRLALHTHLELLAEEHPVPAVFPTPSRNSRQGGNYLPLALAALLVIALTGAWLLGPSSRSTPSPLANSASPAEGEPVAQGFAVVTDQSNAQWAEGRSFSQGELIPPGPLRLESGTVQLDLFSGVTVIAEGAASFEIVSSMEMRVHEGKLRALVPPPARGFVVQTNQGQLVDLGTEFAVDVQSDHADVHVLDGEIEWHPVDAPKQRFETGEAVRWTRQGEAAPLEPVLHAASSVSALEASLARQREERRRLWQSQNTSHATDPRVIAYFPMNTPGPWHRRLQGSGPGQMEGTIVRTQRVADRWGHADTALDFSPTGSRVRLYVPGSHSALTLYCWARIDSLDRWYNSLFLTDGHELHEPHWQIMNDGRLFFSVKAHEKWGPNNPDKHICFSPSFWSASLSGRWIQLATTYDSATGEVLHYLNGEVLSRETVPEAMRVTDIRIGAASIGNWSEPKRNDPDFAIRNLNGAIDEFLLLNTALTPGEIASLYQAGKP